MDTRDAPKADEVLKDPSASHWLKDALQSAIQRDCLDALRDAEVLTAILRARLPAEFRPDVLPLSESRENHVLGCPGTHDCICGQVEAEGRRMRSQARLERVLRITRSP